MYRHGQEEIDAAARVLKNGQWFRYGDPKAGHLQEAVQFENELAAWTGAAHACFTSSGTAALMCCYAGLNMGPGDEVIIPGYTWVASALAPLAMGVVPVMVDIDESLMIDPAAIERAITPRTKAIDPVHMVGLACDMDRIMDIARRYNLAVIEDACQCDGGRWTGGRKLGAVGDMGAFSFNFFKTISCGDGGAFLTNRRDAYERGLILHDGGCIFRPHAADIGVEFFCGMNLRGNEILAAIMRVQLSRLEGIIADLHAVRARILRSLDDCDDVTPIPFNGGEGTGTGGYLGFQFPDEASARGFSAEFNAKVGGTDGAASSLPIDSGRHVYSNWGPVITQRGSYNDARDPFRDPRNAHAPTYGPDSLPRTLQILKRTVLIPVNPDWTAARSGEIATAVRLAAAKHPSRTPEGSLA
jgi:dTDP-4-amino-4,6-dideoxygalactose transaminase